MNIFLQAFMEKLPMSDTMRDSYSLALIDRVCAAYEKAGKDDDTDLANEIMRVIRAIAAQSHVTLIADGPAARLLRDNLADDPVLWTIVSVEDDCLS
jgi:hypothetical protein